MANYDYGKTLTVDGNTVGLINLYSYTGKNFNGKTAISQLGTKIKIPLDKESYVKANAIYESRPGNYRCLKLSNLPGGCELGAIMHLNNDGTPAYIEIGSYKFKRLSDGSLGIWQFNVHSQQNINLQPTSTYIPPTKAYMMFCQVLRFLDDELYEYAPDSDYQQADIYACYNFVFYEKDDDDTLFFDKYIDYSTLDTIIAKKYNGGTRDFPFITWSPSNIDSGTILSFGFQDIRYSNDYNNLNAKPLQITTTGQYISNTPTQGGYGGNTGAFNNDSDTIDFDDAPNLSALGTGLISMFTPTQAQLENLGQALWSEDFIQNVAQLWTDPLSLIISLGIVPMALNKGALTNVKLGGLELGLLEAVDSVAMYKLDNQYFQVDCGSITLSEYFGNFLDYNPYTQCQIYLPFVGTQHLDIDDVMGSTIHVKYNVDLLSGAFVCQIKCTRENLDSVLYNYNGNLMTPLPITSHNFQGLYSSVIQGLGGIAQVATGNVFGGASTIASATLSNKQTINRSGSISGNTGSLSHMKPYLILNRPIQNIPANYNSLHGYPSNMYQQLGDLSGYTVIDSINVDSLTCTQEEKNEIISLLKNGVYL